MLLDASQVGLVVKDLPANAGDIRDVGSRPGWERSPGRGHGNPLQFSCLEKPHGQGSPRATVHRVAESDMNEAAEHTSVIAMVISPKAVLREANFFW